MLEVCKHMELYSRAEKYLQPAWYRWYVRPFSQTKSKILWLTDLVLLL